MNQQIRAKRTTGLSMGKMQCRSIFAGKAKGILLLTSQPISFYGGVDADTGVVVEKGHELEGKSVSGKILAFPQGKGSTVGSYILYRLKKNNAAPLAIINREAETIVAVGAIISEIPMVDRADFRKLAKASGKTVEVDAAKGTILTPK